MKKLKICILDICYSISVLALTDNSEDKEPFPNMLRKKPDNYIFMTQLTSKHLILDLHTVIIYSLRLSAVYRQVQTMKRTNQILSSYIQKFESVFAKNNFDILSEHYHYNHTIKLTLRAEPKLPKIHSLSSIKQIELDIFLAENLYIDKIHFSKSPMSTLIFFIKKRDSLLQLVQDYRMLNFITIKNKCPLYLISKLISQLCNAKCFIKLYVYQSFNNI